MTRTGANFGPRRRASLRVVPLALLLLSCAGNSDPPARSPTTDYPLPPPQTSDGQVLGADNRAPEDRLQEGPSTDGPAPGWSIDEHGVKYDPERPPRGTTPPDAPADAPAKPSD